MRAAFTKALLEQLEPALSVFLTGDLGFMALEPLRERLGARFINAGVAEQNMVSAAAGLAKSGLEVWVYSIAPFCYARPFEQIRNDLCLHNLPVRLVGNGGGYGYGVMGATHHAIEDYGALLTLQHMRVWVPAFSEDVAPAIGHMRGWSSPGYLRLGRCERPARFSAPPYASWRRLLRGDGPVVVYVGPIVSSHLNGFLALDEADRPDVWLVTELPLKDEDVPLDFVRRSRGAEVWVIEEHVAQGSFGMALASFLLRNRIQVTGFEHFAAKGYPSGRAGSQEFYRRESGIDQATLMARIRERLPAVVSG